MLRSFVTIGQGTLDELEKNNIRMIFLFVVLIYIMVIIEIQQIAIQTP